MKAPALLQRFPKLYWRPDLDQRWPGDWPVVPEGAEQQFPQLAQDFAVWSEGLLRQFRHLDHVALVLQNQFWRQRVALILGGLMATLLGAYQAAIGGGQKWVAAAQAVLTGLLVGLTALARGRNAQNGYFTARLKAERIKSEYFLFLGRVGDYAGRDREVRLRQQVEDIADAGEAP